MTTRRIVLGTHNKKKRKELAQLLEPFGFELFTLDDFDASIDVEETGQTFAENAKLKATKQAANLGEWVLAEDSGLCVDALSGAPGVYSARYAGEPCDDEANNRKLLQELAGVPSARRTAAYACSVALSDPQGTVRATSEGGCRGRIRETPAGTHGFGYDPLFEIPEYHRTFGELGDAVKSVLSHRSRAVARIVPCIIGLSRGGGWPAGTHRSSIGKAASS